MSAVRRVAAVCAGALATTVLAAATATASPLDDVLDALNFGSSGPPTSTVLRPATVRFLESYGEGATVSFVKMSTSCVELPADPTNVGIAAAGTAVTLTVNQARTRECLGRSGDAVYKFVVTTPAGVRYGGARLKVNYGEQPATFIGCEAVTHPTGTPINCLKSPTEYATLVVVR